VSSYSVIDGQGGVRRYELRYRDGRSDRLHGWLGFGQRILVDVDTGATTATFYDKLTKLEVGERDVYPFRGASRAAMALGAWFANAAES
jgi:hypothetical protein